MTIYGFDDPMSVDACIIRLRQPEAGKIYTVQGVDKTVWVRVADVVVGLWNARKGSILEKLALVRGLVKQCGSNCEEQPEQ